MWAKKVVWYVRTTLIKLYVSKELLAFKKSNRGREESKSSESKRDRRKERERKREEKERTFNNIEEY